ncbi:MAG TPA: FAD-binding dehydrogenase [Glutamicibacter sp.]|uniref:FAD binding domain-containing protein n=1 Tax=Glutamicibacter arilaitensis (strain DSM 16368 / CIP 108037 / IAM 15318 / JCM 13566 / NCIMB 14258 / Re117) TaxID=861360 RepID=A0ABP1U5M3_GLUAR|nr:MULTISPECIES: FAD-binding dehydrogenase [Glutamicibacter]CBT76087.1 FAD binding domain-containing protein [Glutamicibacter arilaitensis Re117]HCH47576.1 FAD-binding dehydrogenase [Glutamicibacter sp.]
MNCEQGGVVIIGAGLAGLVAASEALDAGLKIRILDQENDANLGGQAYWSFGGLFLVDTPEQRRLGVHDSFDLAWSDWQHSAQFDRLADEDLWAHRWAKAYVEFAATEKRSWIKQKGIDLTPVVGWAERGDGRAEGHGNSVPRFHIAWGTGTGVSEPFANKVREGMRTGKVQVLNRHRVTGLVVEGGSVTGVRGEILSLDNALRGWKSTRNVESEFEFSAEAVVIATGGIGGNHDLVRRFWPSRLGSAPGHMITGVPEYVDGSGIELSEAAGARLVNRDRMWHYTEGIQNWNSIWPNHGIRILPGPSSMWFDAEGNRLGAACLPGDDTLGTLKYLRTDPVAKKYDYSWFVLNQRILEKEFALSGSEQNPDLTNRDKAGVIKDRVFGTGAPGPVNDFLNRGADFVAATTVEELASKMNAIAPETVVDASKLHQQLLVRDSQIDNAFSKDQQIQSIRNARKYIGDRLTRVVAPHKILDPAAGPLVAVKLHILTRKSLGGLQTDLSGRVLQQDGRVFEGLYAAGEASGFGGGGIHGYNALEGTFLGGCLFSGRQVGRAVVDAVR